MNNKNIILVAVFLVAAGIGFFITTQLKSCSNPTQEDSIIVDTLISENSIDTPEPVIPESNSTEPDNKVKLFATSPANNNGVYSFKASCSGVEGGYYFELWSNKLEAKSNDGYFSDIPATSSAKYKLALFDSTGKLLATKMVGGFKDASDIDDSSQPTEKTQFKLISESDLQQRINSHDGSLQGGKKSPVDRKARIETIGQKGDELKSASDLADIFEKMDFGKWKSVQVVEVDYNNKGVVTRIKVKPVY